MYYFVYLIIIRFVFISSHYDLFMRALFEQPNGLKGDIAKTFTLTYQIVSLTIATFFPTMLRLYIIHCGNLPVQYTDIFFLL